LEFLRFVKNLKNLGFYSHFPALDAAKLCYVSPDDVTRVVCSAVFSSVNSTFEIQGSHTWRVLDFLLKSPGKSLWSSWKVKLKVVESPAKISLKVMHFPSGSN